MPAHRLIGMATGRRPDRAEPTFVGRQWEMGALNGVLDRSINGSGSIVGVVGPPGIGKSRIVRELTARAKAAGVEVFATYCESHTTDLPFHAAAGLVCDVTAGWTAWTTRPRAEQVRDASRGRRRGPDPARRPARHRRSRRLRCPRSTRTPAAVDVAAMVKAAALARSTPVVYVIEDAHWIDGDQRVHAGGVPGRRSADAIARRDHLPAGIRMAHLPMRPGRRRLRSSRWTNRRCWRWAPSCLGEDRSVTELAELIAERAAGNPFFAEEIVRDLSERDVLVGGRGCYLCTGPVADVHVPSTLQAVIAARIDRLDPAAKRTLNAAAVIGSRFTPDMLQALQIEAALGELAVGGAHRPDSVRPTARVRFPASADPSGRIRITAQIRSRAAA